MSLTNNSRRVVQDQPAMRSVALASTSSTSTSDYVTASPLRLRTFHSYDSKFSNNSRNTATSHAATTTTATTSQFVEELAKHQTSVETTISTNNAIIGSWIVKDQSLKGIPDLYPLERTHVIIFDATAQQIMDRIAECLREKSIAATLDDHKVALQAETRDHIRFIVNLFRGYDDIDDDNINRDNTHSKVIVEVQRRSGCSFVFHQCSDAVLNAAQGIRNKPCSFKKFTIPDCVKQLAAEAAASSASSLSMEQLNEATRERVALEADLENALRLWKSDRYDAQLLGMESLVLLSSQNESRKHLAAICAHSMLCTECVQKKLLSLILLHSNGHDYHDWADERDALVVDHVQRMRRYALIVFANCLEALAGDNFNHVSSSCDHHHHHSNELQHVMSKNEALRSPDLMDVLVTALNHAEHNPHDAHQAARCLGVLCRCCSMCKGHATELGAMEAVTKALDVGTVRHSLLEGVSRQLQHEMEFS